MRHCLLAGMFLALAGFAWALVPDATREQVIAELGKPTSVAKLGEREIMIYPKGVRLELEEGKVVAAKGIALSDSVAAPVPPEAIPAPVKSAKEPDAVEQQKRISAEENDAVEHEFEPDKSKGPVEIDKVIKGLESERERSQHPASKVFSVVAFLVELGLKFVLTVAALKLACKYWGAEVFWSGIFTVSAVDVIVRGGMALIGTLVLGFPTLFYADEAVAALVMVLLLKKISINHSIAQAIELTMTTKTFSIVVGSFLVTVLLRLMH